MKLLLDFFPIILFFVAFKVWGIYVTTAVAIVATIGFSLQQAIEFTHRMLGYAAGAGQ